MSIVNDPMVKTFFQDRSLAENTKERYKRELKIYFNFIEKTPSETILGYENEEDERVRMRERKIKSDLLSFKDYLSSTKWSDNTIRGNINTVKSFFKNFEIELPQMKMPRMTPRNENINDIPNREHIATALKFANQKYSAIILLMASSGMGASEILSLKYSDLLKSLEDDIKIPKRKQLDIEYLTDLVEEKGNIIPTWRIIRIKTNSPYVTFSTPESLDAILTYLKIDPPIRKDVKLFRAQHNAVGSMNRINFHNYFHELNDRCGFGKNGRQVFMRSHALRKFAASMMYKTGIPQLSIDFFLGHKIDSTTEAYFKADTKSLKKQYFTCIKALSIRDTEPQIIKDNDLIDLEAKMKENDLAHKKEVDKLMGLITDLYKEKGIDINKPSKTIEDYDPGDE